MGKRIRRGQRVRLKDGPAAGIMGTVIDDFDGRVVQWDGATITVPAGLVTREAETALAPVRDNVTGERTYG